MKDEMLLLLGTEFPLEQAYTEQVGKNKEKIFCTIP